MTSSTELTDGDGASSSVMGCGRCAVVEVVDRWGAGDARTEVGREASRSDGSGWEATVRAVAIVSTPACTIASKPLSPLRFRRWRAATPRKDASAPRTLRLPVSRELRVVDEPVLGAAGPTPESVVVGETS